MAAPIAASDIILYDVDYSGRHALSGEALPTAGPDFPGRSDCSDIVFGNPTIGDAPAGWQGTAALLTTPESTNHGAHRLCQLRFRLTAGGVYAFRRHRIETTFQFPQTEDPESVATLNFHFDGSAVTWLSFGRDGSVRLAAEVMEPLAEGGEREARVVKKLTTLETGVPVHLFLELDSPARSARISVNGAIFTVSDLQPLGGGLRNRGLHPGPIDIRVSHDSYDKPNTVALKAIRITGSDYDGPLLHDGELPSQPSSAEIGVVTIPFAPPATGAWYPQFSVDGRTWMDMGAPHDEGQVPTHVSFGALIAPRMFFRTVEIP